MKTVGEEYKKQIECLEREKINFNVEINLLRKENEDLLADYRTLERKQDNLEKECNNAQIQIRNMQGHIEQLMESERNLKSELEIIKSSRIYRFMTFIGKIIEFFFPLHSKRRFFLSITKRCVRHPIRTMQKFSISRVRNMFRYLNEQDIESVSERFDECVGSKTFESTIEYEEIPQIESLDECDEIVFDEVSEPLVSIIIPVYNQFSFTYKCLQSIKQNSETILYEIIIADDCSTDLTCVMEEKIKNVIRIKTGHNMKFLGNCNNAAKHARGKYILFLNNDTQVQENWLEPLVELLEKDSTIGMVGSKLVYPNGKLQEAGGIIWNDGSGWNYGNRQNPDAPEYNYVRDVDYISGASIMLSLKLWNQIGGFDTLFSPAYCEDSDLAFEVRKAGYRVVYQPKSVVVHFEGISNGTDVKEGVKKYQTDNQIKLREKWKKELASQYTLESNIFRARERSMGKKIILFIDHYVPHYDQDAGSKTIFQYLQMFVQKGYIVKFVGDNFYQHEPYTTVLQQMGIEVLYGPYYASHILDWIKLNRREIDFIFMNRPHISIKYIDYVKKYTNIKVIYYGHDLHFLRNRREYELTGNVKKKKESEEWLEKELYLMKKADISYYPSCIEEQEIHKIDNSIPVKAITAYVFEKFKEQIPMDMSKREGILFVGGFGHDPNLDAVFWFVDEIWPLVRKRVSINFYIVGSHAPNQIKDLDGKDGIIVKGYISDDELSRLYEKCKIVVVPLRYGAGVKGKVVEALYNGTPIVTTSVGSEGIADAEQIMMIEDQPVLFAERIVQLYQDEEKLQAMICKSQEYVKENYSIEAVWNIIAEDF